MIQTILLFCLSRNIAWNVCMITMLPAHPKKKNALSCFTQFHIGRNCWLGAGVIVVPGVTIGDNTVIGAGSVVTKDIPANVVAVGNPCHILRPINEHDQEYYHRTMKIKECNI